MITHSDTRTRRSIDKIIISLTVTCSYQALILWKKKNKYKFSFHGNIFRTISRKLTDIKSYILLLAFDCSVSLMHGANYKSKWKNKIQEFFAHLLYNL